MRVSIARKVFLLFCILTSMTIIMGTVVFFGMRDLFYYSDEIEVIKDFQLQIKSLESFHQKLSALHAPPDIKNLENELESARGMVHSILDSPFKLSRPLRERLMTVQKLMGYYQQAYIELFEKYDEDRKLPMALLASYQTILERVENAPLETRDEFFQVMRAMLSIETHIYHGRELARIPMLYDLAKRMSKITDDHVILGAFQQFIRGLEMNYVNYLAIQNRRDFLQGTADNFYQVANDVISSLHSSEQQRQRMLTSLLVFFPAAAILLTLALWYYAWRYIRSFLGNHKRAIAAMESGDFDFEMLSGSDDELGDLTVFMKNLALRLKDNITKLSESEGKYRGLVENISSWVWETDEHGMFTYSSPSVGSILGYAPKEIVGTFIFDLMPEGTACKPGSAFRKIYGKEQPFFSMENSFRHKDRGIVIIETSAIPARDPSGAFKGYRGISADITVRKQAEEENKKLQTQLLQAQKMEAVGRLAGGIAHDFNNLLTAILGYSEMCLFTLSSADPLRKNIEAISNAGKRATGLIKQLLAFSRKQVIEKKVVNLNDIIKNMMEMLARLIGEDVELRLDLEPALKNMEADLHQIEQIILNIAVNARDAMPEGGTLLIETQNVDLDSEFLNNHKPMMPGAYIILGMTDTGQGMTKEVRKQIFEPFFTTKSQDKGTGLGLATVFGIVEQHAGHIDVDSAPGRGSSFTIYFPAVLTAQASQEECSAALPRGREKILVVDDDPAVRQYVSDSLQQLGYQVIMAASGKEALEIGQSLPDGIDLLLTDVIMPKMNGKELARTLTAACPSLKVIFMSGYTDNTIVHQGMLDPSVVLVHKPLMLGQVAFLIRKVLDG